ncbi:MAG: UDP-3-O-(3-hydroxymyristoyl)glucosamine N-acyltransferase [Flavobacteriales bacterium]|nr:UDP-3-O-(3-hydroxymyristoyl)glucosamine N-acyltransferase [Flavobacteriales bacterium]
MKFDRIYKLEEIANIIGTEFVGDSNFEVHGMNEIHVVETGDIVFVDHPKYYNKALESAATIVLINKKVACPEGKALLISDDPFRDFNKLTNKFNPFIASSSAVAESAVIGEGSVIQPGAVIGENVKIGKNCIIHPNVTIYKNAVIGNNVIIHANTVLGGDAFYYKRRPEGYDRLLSGGNVVLEDNVEIGSSCTIDRGVSGSTTIKFGTKIDNSVQIGHDTVIGKHCLIASQTGIAGANVIEDEVTMWGQVGITSGVTIAKKTVILAQSGITKSTVAGTSYFGSPAVEVRKGYRELAALRDLPNFIKNAKK